MKLRKTEHPVTLDTFRQILSRAVNSSNLPESIFTFSYESKFNTVITSFQDKFNTVITSNLIKTRF